MRLWQISFKQNEISFVLYLSLKLYLSRTKYTKDWREKRVWCFSINTLFFLVVRKNTQALNTILMRIIPFCSHFKRRPSFLFIYCEMSNDLLLSFSICHYSWLVSIQLCSQIWVLHMFPVFECECCYNIHAFK